MAQAIELAVEPRAKAGKGSARAARREGLIPAVIYGGKEAPVMVTIKRNELVRLMNKGGFLSHQFKLIVGDKIERVLPRDIQVHPVNDEPLHVDFLRITKDSRVVVEIPVTFTGEEESPGLIEGGVLNVVRPRLEVEVPATEIPEEIFADVSKLEIGDQLRASMIDLGADVKLTITDRDFMIATISAPSALRAEEDAEADEGEEPEEPELTKQKGDGEGAAEDGDSDDE